MLLLLLRVSCETKKKETVVVEEWMDEWMNGVNEWCGN